jgi:hypothetical protein
MARHAFIPPTLVFPNLNDAGLYENNALALRDTFRDGWVSPSLEFNQALASPRWKVSDIGSRSGGAYDLGYYFILRDTTNNCEYLFVLSGRDATTSPAEFHDLWGDGTGGHPHLQPASIAPVSAGGSTYTRGGIAVYFNPDYATSSMIRSFGFDDTTNLTYTGGDFTEVATAPSTSALVLSDWLPVGGVDYPKGLLFYNNAVTADPVGYAFVLDDVLDNMAIFTAAADSANARACDLFGLVGRNVILPALVTDTYTQGAAWWQLNSGDNTLGSHTRAHASGFTAAGTRIHDYDQEYLNLYTYHNQVTTLGDVKWRAVPITSASDTAKGHLNPDVVREIGAFDNFASMPGTVYDAPLAATPMIKASAAAAIMYAQNMPLFPFPFSGWGTTEDVVV